MSIPTSEQAQEFSDAIMTAIDGVRRRMERPDMGALLGALAGAQALYIASIGNRALRRGTERQVNDLLSKLITEGVEKGPAVRVVPVKRGS